jgi:bacillithiol synthase
VLGTSVQVLGPGELSYMPQVAPLYRLLGIEPPAVALRPQSLVLGSHQVEKLAGLELDLAELVAADLDLDRVLAQGREAELLRPARARLELLLEELGASALAVDRDLEGPWGKTRQQIERALETFSGKLAASLARHDQLRRRRAEELRTTCRPLGALQERVISTAHFLGKYDESLAEAYFSQLELDPRRLQVIVP